MELERRRLAKQISLDWSRTERLSFEFTSTERGKRFAEKQESLEDGRQQTIYDSWKEAPGRIGRGQERVCM